MSQGLANGAVTVRPLGEGMDFYAIPSKRFKTTGIMVLMTLPLDREKAAQRALVVRLLGRTNEKYPTMSAMKKQMAMLYGANMSGAANRQADTQSLMLTVSSLADRFALDGEVLSMQCAQLLCDSLLCPAMEGDSLSSDNVEMEKRLLREHLEAQRGDKIMYSLERCIEETFEGQPASVNPEGEVQQVEGITPQSATEAWRELLRSARIFVLAAGDMDFDAVYEVFRSRLAGLERAYSEFAFGKSAPAREQSRTVDEQAVTVQSKLVMSLQLPPREPEDFSGVMLSECLGGSPSSRLFTTVREKLSLCYYCASMYMRRKETVFVYSGLETDKLKTAREEIIRQCRWIADGKLTAEEIEAARMSYANRCAMVEESIATLLMWYIRQLPEKLMTPQQAAEAALAVTPEQIAQAASELSEDTVYILRGILCDELEVI